MGGKPFGTREHWKNSKFKKKSQQALFVDGHLSRVSKTEEGQVRVGVPNKTDMIFCFVASMARVGIRAMR